jgi:hypothetical protein
VTGRAAVGPRRGQAARVLRSIRGDRRALTPLHVTLIIVAVIVVVALLFVPLPWIGLNYYNVNVKTTLGETCFIACSYSVQSVNPSVAGPATILDIGGWFPGANIAPPCINCQYKVVAQLSNGQSTSASESKFVSNLLNIDYTDTLTMAIAYVPAGTYPVTVTVFLNGASVAQGSGSLTVGG